MSVTLLKAILAYKRLERKKKSTGEKAKTPRVTQFSIDEKICRICCEEGEILIFNEKSLGKSIADEINKCSGLTISPSDDLPRYLCEGCHGLLQSSIKFRKMCRQSTQKLHKLKVQQSDASFEPKREVSVKAINSDSEDEVALRTPSAFSCTCGRTFHTLIEHRDHALQCYKKESARKRGRKCGKSVREKVLCEVCGKCSSSRAQHLIHATIHTNNFPFHCNHCPYKARHKDLLVIHLKTHLAVKPFMCEFCPRTFNNTSNLRKHRWLHQPQQLPCPECSIVFVSKPQLQRHLRSAHSNEAVKLSECDKCEKTFKSRSQLRKHRFTKHNLRPSYPGRLPSYLMYERDNFDIGPNTCLPLPGQPDL